MQSDRKTPLISVILPAYNCERYVSRAIESILNQTFSNLELIIADDGSSDCTRDIINTFTDKRIKTFHNGQNVGKVRTVNGLIKHCHGDFVTIHDADDYSHPIRFEKQTHFLENNPDYALCGTSFYSGNIEGPFVKITQMPKNYDQIKRNYLKESQVHGPTMVFRKNILDKVGGLYRSPELFRNKEDIEFISRVIEKYKVMNLAEPLYYYRNLPNSLSKSGYNYLKFEGMKVIKFLSDERKLNGIDSLSLGGSKALDSYLMELQKPYLIDKSLLHRKSAAHLMYFNFFSQALKQSVLGIIKQPFIFDNYRTAQYCMRKTLLAILKEKYEAYIHHGST